MTNDRIVIILIICTVLVILIRVGMTSSIIQALAIILIDTAIALVVLLGILGLLEWTKNH